MSKKKNSKVRRNSIKEKYKFRGYTALTIAPSMSVTQKPVSSNLMVLEIFLFERQTLSKGDSSFLCALLEFIIHFIHKGNIHSTALQTMSKATTMTYTID